MRLAIITDIHSNFDALTAALQDIDTRRVDQIINLGDFIGYGPEPEQVFAALRQRDIPSVLGNHENAIRNPLTIVQMNSSAARSIELTRRLLTPATLEYIATLPKSVVQNGLRFVHGLPPDAVNKYLTWTPDEEIRQILSTMTAWCAFVGHTHQLAIIELDNFRLTRQRLTQDVHYLKKDSRYIINCGSIGQPRDGDRRAKYVVFDSDQLTVEARFVEYDPRRTAELIHALGFPAENAYRLF